MADERKVGQNGAMGLPMVDSTLGRGILRVGARSKDSIIDTFFRGPRQDLSHLFTLHDEVSATQRRLVRSYPGVLPMPLREDPLYYDGSQFYMRLAAETLRDRGRDSLLTKDQHTWVISTMGVSDWWMDESGKTADGRRDYGPAIEAFDGINAICYSYLRPDPARDPITSSNPEIQRLIDYHAHVLDQVPEEHRPSIARSLFATNLYQSVSLYQERGYREYMGLGDIENTTANKSMLERMQIEKGGFMFTYFWPYFPDIVNGITIPDEPPTIESTLQSFLNGNSFYPTDGLGRFILEMGGANQLLNDIADAKKDLANGVSSPQNLGVVYVAGSDSMVERVFERLDALRGPDDSNDFNLVLDAGDNALSGATIYRANKKKL